MSRRPEITLSQPEVRALLDELCRTYGFCLPPQNDARIMASPPTTVDAFIHEVFLAEGLDIEMADRHLVRQMRGSISAFFARHEDIVTFRRGT